MSYSDEEKVQLDDEIAVGQSMDEVHELEEAMQLSVDTAASSPIKLPKHDLSSNSEESDEGGSNSDSSDGDFAERFNGGGDIEFVRRDRGESSDEDSDEPPEIPGSPIAQKFHVGNVTAADFGAKSRFSTVRSNIQTTGDFGQEEEYEVKEVEQSRAAEFLASSSSEDEESDNDTERSTRDRNKLQQKIKKSALGRPKTAAKDLEKYRDVVPNEFFAQFEETTTLDDANASTYTPLSQPDNIGLNISWITNVTNEKNQRKYKVAVPREIEELFNLTDAYIPKDVDIETRLEPFLPEFTPSVGVPFDGILIPRPDGKKDNIGVDVLREPSGQTNVAELELLLQERMANQNKLRSRDKIVRSIERASHRPQEVDQWIASVEQVQRTKPLPQVKYKQSMPRLSRLMELWPEKFEEFLTTRNDAIPALSGLDVCFRELVRIVCAMLDIPVYEDNYVQSLHVLFSLYLEIESNERDASSKR